MKCIIKLSVSIISFIDKLSPCKHKYILSQKGKFFCKFNLYHKDTNINIL